MSNFAIIKDQQQLAKLFENTVDKLISVLFYTKNNPQCRVARQHFERCATNNIISSFCIIDTDNYDGDRRIIDSIANMPHIDFYFQTKKIGSYSGSDQKSIDDCVQAGQRYVMTEINTKNNLSHMNQTQMYGQQQQMQSQMFPQQYPVQHQPQMFQPPTMTSSQMMNPQMKSGNMELPTMEQLQYIWKLFQMMQNMNILNMNAQPVTPEQAMPQKIEGEVVLPSGDKLIPLSDGKYGLIKKSN